jgi:hypothetical protein
MILIRILSGSTEFSSHSTQIHRHIDNAGPADDIATRKHRQRGIRAVTDRTTYMSLIDGT